MLFELIPLLFFVATPLGQAEHILGLFLHPGYSHFHSFFPILKGLADRGHNVTAVTFFPVKNRPKNYREILLEGDYPISGLSVAEIAPSRSIRKLIEEYYALEQEGRTACENFYNSNTVDTIFQIHSETPFDLTIHEVFNTDCMLGVVELLKTPFVGLSSCAMMPWHYDRVGLPDFPSFVPSEFVGSSFEMSFEERIVNFFVAKLTKILYRLSQLEDNRIISKHLAIDIDVREKVKNTSLILVNQHYSLSGSRPLSHRVIEIGGSHIPKSTNPLPKELDDFLNDSENGVIFISWGSMVNFSSIPTETVMAIANSLKKFRERVVWKWETNEKLSDSNQFFFSKWTPQFDLLCHPKVRLFWSHGGLLGTTESVHCATPMVITPMYGDQYLNARAIQKRKMGLILNYEDITEENVYNTISKALQPEFARNAKYISDVFRNRQNPPLETALWWIEHVLHTQGSNLTYSPSVEMNWFTYYSIDAILTLASALLIVLLIPVYCISKACALMKTRCSPCRPKSVQSVPKKKKTH